MASLSGNNKIVLKANYTEGGAQHEEGILSGAATPGMNLVMTTAVESIGRHTYAAGATLVGGTAAGAAAGPVKVLKEDALQGKTITDAYASGDDALIHICLPGDVIQVLVLAGEDIDKLEGLSANSAGKWIAATISSRVESLEDSGGALAADTHMRVRVL